MHLVIAEKRDQAERLAAPFPIKTKGMGLIEVLPCDVFPKGATFTWASGHIVKLKDPEEYNPAWRSWNMDQLPMIPEEFEFVVDSRHKELFKRMKSLLNNQAYTAVINACDPGREGEAIFGYIYELSGSKKPKLRLWTSSLTPDAVLKAFQTLLPGESKQSLYYEAYARACADWLIGMNTSRAYTLQLQKGGYAKEVFSTGRVQTPVLGMIVNREKSIQNFRSEPFWEVFCSFEMNSKTYKGKFFSGDTQRLADSKQAETLSAYCHDKPAKIHHIEKVAKQTKAPLLYNLSSLQMAANKKFKLSPEETNKITDAIYLKGYISYPRTDSHHVTPNEAATFPSILKGLESLLEYKELLPVSKPNIMDDKRYVDAKKVSDHYAIIPTEKIPKLEELDNQQRQVYDLIARSLIAAHYDPCTHDHTSITTLVDERFSFFTSSKILVHEGWKKVIGLSDEESTELLPNLQAQEEGSVASSEVKEGATKPAARYTLGDLIGAMKNAGKEVDDVELRSVMNRTHGLGTEATRANIIKKLIDLKYIEIKHNLVYPTDKGKLLIESIGDQSALGSAILTAKWEQVLQQIGTGQVTHTSFMNSAKKLAEKLVLNANDSISLVTTESIASMPIVQPATPSAPALAISNSVSTAAPAPASAPKQNSEVQPVNNAHETNPVIQKPSSPSATQTAISTAGLGSCKKCGQPVIELSNFYGCSNFKVTGCDFRISKTIKGVTIQPDYIKQLLRENCSPLIKGFDAKNKPYDAYLTFNEQNKLCFRYPKKKSFRFPIHMLKKHDLSNDLTNKMIPQMIKDVERESELIKLTSKVVKWFIGPKVIRFELLPAEGLNIASFRRYKDNFQRILAADTIQVYTPLPGQKFVGIEIPNPNPYPIYLRSMMEDYNLQQHESILFIPIGMDQRGDMIFADIGKMPHLLIGGQTNSGKSVLMNTIIVTLISKASPEELKFIFIDPKMVEFAPYAGIPHLEQPIITDPNRALSALTWLRQEMDRRYRIFLQAGVRDITGYNEKRKIDRSLKQLPFIITMIDELADLMLSLGSSLEEALSSVSALARGAGIHLIVATQRPTRDIISAVIKTNLPTKIALSVETLHDSKAIIGESGAEKLLGAGDMYYKSSNGAKSRAQSAYVSIEEIRSIVDYLKTEATKEKILKDTEAKS